MYAARRSETVYVLHAFQKKAQKTRREDIELAIRRHRQIGESAMKNKIIKSSGNVFSDLVRGKYEKFSLDMLIVLNTRVGNQITLEIT